MKKLFTLLFLLLPISALAVPTESLDIKIGYGYSAFDASGLMKVNLVFSTGNAAIPATSQITSGTFNISRISQASVTQYQSNFVIASTQITGTKTSTYISDFTVAAQTAAARIYEGTTLRTSTIGYASSATVASGVAVFQLTTNGLSSGVSVFPNGVITTSVNAIISDSVATYQMSYTFSNNNKTLTIAVNKLTTANILTGVIGQTPANGSLVNIQVWGY